jgi:hypothetical protein
LLVVAAGGGVAFWFLTAPRLEFENRLIRPVKVTVAGRDRLVEAGARTTIRRPRGRGSPLAWSMVRDTNQRGEPLGLELSGTVNLDRRRARVAADAGAAEGAWFAPLITNNTGRPLTVIVNAGLRDAMSCGCQVPPGATRQAVGYYPLFQNSTVRVRDPDGRSATFTSLGGEVDRRSGVVRLKFEAADLR